ncbi:MAG: DNA repair protein RecO [Bacteroidales bacterium]
MAENVIPEKQKPFVGCLTRIGVSLYMIEKSQAIVLHTVRCATGSTLARLYTERRGIMTVSLPGNKSKGAVRKSIFQPFSLLEMEIEFRENKEIQRVVEAHVATVSHTIMTHPGKLAISLFMSELVTKTVQQREPDQQLFSFLQRSIELLDLSEEGIANFHLLFMCRLSIHLGFFPHTDGMNDAYCFDLLNVRFIPSVPSHPHYCKGIEMNLLSRLLQTGFTNVQELSLNRDERNLLIDLLLSYYRLHIGPMAEIRSLDVLRTLFST